MPAYNRDRVSEEFRQLADLADAAFRANLSNLSADPTAMQAHDELLARACVFGYLYDRHFLASPELLLNELRWLRGTRRPEAPRNCLHPARFASHRAALLDLLVNRFQGLLDYRESIEPTQAPSALATSRVAGRVRGDASGPENVRQDSDPAEKAE